MKVRSSASIDVEEAEAAEAGISAGAAAGAGVGAVAGGWAGPAVQAIAGAGARETAAAGEAVGEAAGARARGAAVRPALACVNDVIRGRAQSVVLVMATPTVSLTRTCRAAALNAAAAAAVAAALIRPGLPGGDALTDVEAPEVAAAAASYLGLACANDGMCE